MVVGERKCFKRMEMNTTDDCGGVVCVRSKRILDLLIESSISGEMSCRMNNRQTLAWWKQVEGKGTDDLRNVAV